MSTQMKGIWIDIWILELDIKPDLKLLLAHISNLDQGARGCWESNENICRYFGYNDRTLQRKLQKLSDAGLIDRQLVYDEDKKTVLERRLFCKRPLPSKITPPPPVKNDTTLPSKMSHRKNSLNKKNSAFTENDYSFNDFWEFYGLKKGRQAAERKWQKLKPEEIEMIRLTLPFYVAETCLDDEKGTKWRPRRKHPATYLNQKVWEDYTDRIEKDKEPTPYDEAYNAYIGWVERKFPNVAQKVTYLSKTQFIEFKQRQYSKWLPQISHQTERRSFERAHVAANEGKCNGELWPYYLRQFGIFADKLLNV